MQTTHLFSQYFWSLINYLRCTKQQYANCLNKVFLINYQFNLPIFLLSCAACACCFYGAPFFISVCVHLSLAASDGRLYRCDVTSGLSNGTLSRTDDGTTGGEDEDDDDWKEHEASRTHSVKFTDPQDQENREVSSWFFSSTTQWLMGYFDMVKGCSVSWCCVSSGRHLTRTSSYYMLNVLGEIDHV